MNAFAFVIERNLLVLNRNFIAKDLDTSGRHLTGAVAPSTEILHYNYIIQTLIILCCLLIADFIDRIINWN